MNSQRRRQAFYAQGLLTPTLSLFSSFLFFFARLINYLNFADSLPRLACAGLSFANLKPSLLFATSSRELWRSAFDKRSQLNP